MDDGLCKCRWRYSVLKTQREKGRGEMQELVTPNPLFVNRHCVTLRRFAGITMLVPFSTLIVYTITQTRSMYLIHT